MRIFDGQADQGMKINDYYNSRGVTLEVKKL